MQADICISSWGCSEMHCLQFTVVFFFHQYVCLIRCLYCALKLQRWNGTSLALTFCNLMKVGLVQRQLHLQLVAGGFSTCSPWPRWHAPSPQIGGFAGGFFVKETACETSNPSVGSDWFCPQRTGKDLRGIGNRLAQHSRHHSQHSRHHSHHDSHHDSQHDGRFHRLGQWHCGCLLGNGPRVLDGAGALFTVVYHRHISKHFFGIP